MAYVLTTEAEIEQKSGANVSVTYDTTCMENAELRGIALIGVLSKYHWHDNLPTDVGIHEFLSDIVSSFVAIEAIAYDMSGYTSRTEAEDMINVLRDGMLRNLSILRDQKAEDFIIKNAT